MCDAYVINGKRCETGADLIAALGRDGAEKVNPPGDWEDGWTEDVWRSTCLCRVDEDDLASLLGVEYAYDPGVDAYSPLPTHQETR